MTTGSGLVDSNGNSSTVFLTTASSTTPLSIVDDTALAVTGDQTIKMSIARQKTVNNTATTDEVSTVKNHTFKIVDISQIRGITISDMDTLYVCTAYSNYATGELAGITSAGALTVDVSTVVRSGGLTDNSTYQNAVTVKGTYNGTSITIPAKYYTAAGSKVYSTSSIGATKYINAVTTTAGAFTVSDLYDATTAKYTRKNATDTLKVTVYPLGSSGIADLTASVVDTASKTISISDAAPYAATIVSVDSGIFTPSNTTISGLGTMLSNLGDYYVLDQYSKGISTTNTYKISNITENDARYAENNFAVTGNDTANASITGAELGDTFTLTISAKDENGVTVSKDVEVTVGADAYANITGSTNNYTDTLVYYYLEPQRNN